MIFRSPNIAFAAFKKRILGAKGAKGAFQGVEKNPLKPFCTNKGVKGAF